jgi:hypothetical protein
LIFFQSKTEAKQPNHPVLDEEETNKSDQFDEHCADQTDRVEKRKISGKKDVYVISTNRPLPDACYVIDYFQLKSVQTKLRMEDTDEEKEAEPNPPAEQSAEQTDKGRKWRKTNIAGNNVRKCNCG